MFTVISHALVRNTLIPLVLGVYIATSGTREYDWVYVHGFVCTVLLAPVYILSVLFGYDPLSWFVASWDNPWSLVEYLVYGLGALLVLFRRTFDHRFSFTLSVVSAGAVGYLYEVPYWLHSGVWSLFRTAQNSLIILDWGMLCVPVAAFFLLCRGFRLRNWMLLPIGFYMLYVYGYYHHSIIIRNYIYHTFGVQKTLALRIPSMMLMLSLLAGVKQR